VVYLYTAQSYPKVSREVRGTVMQRWPNEDLAVLLVRLPDRPAVLRLCPKGETKIARPFPVLTVGSSRPDGPPEIIMDQVLDYKNIKKPDGTEANYWEACKPQAVGRSGGPLVDQRGYVVGICSGREKGKGYYTHIAEIHYALRGPVYQWLLAPPAGGGK